MLLENPGLELAGLLLERVDSINAAKYCKNILVSVDQTPIRSLK